jgi:hypothetical protein
VPIGALFRIVRNKVELVVFHHADRADTDLRPDGARSESNPRRQQVPYPTREASMRYSRRAAASVLAAAMVGILAPAASAEEFHARLSGFNEVGALNNETGAILSTGRGMVDIDLNKNAGTLTYTLTYSDLSAPVTQAHIHFGKIHVPGGVFVFFCTNLANGPAGTPSCPSGGGTVSGTVGPAGVVAVAGQNITAGDFNAVVEALTSDTAYANVHTARFPAGEIRGQIRRGGGDEQ